MRAADKNQAFLRRATFAWNGIRQALASEASFRFQALAAGAVVVLLGLTRPAPLWWAILVLPVGGVLSAELFNTALEKVVDRLHPERHPDIKIAKDCAAGAVLVFSLVSLVVLAAFLVEIAGRHLSPG